MSEPRPGITLVGAGRAGVALGRLLYRAGFPILAVVTRSAESSREAVRSIGSGWEATLEEDFPLGEVLLLAVPDDSIRTVARTLASRSGPGSPRAALHLSGAHGLGELEDLSEAGVSVGSLHPIRAFPRGVVMDRIDGTWFGVEGEGDALESARTIVAALGGRELRIPEGGRALYHAACCFASNAVVAALAEGMILLGHAGIAKEDAVAALLTLVQGSIDAVGDDPRSAMTGPVVRGDLETLSLHVEAMRDVKDRSGLRFYRAFSRHLATLASEIGLQDPGLSERIHDLLRDTDTDV